MIHLTTIYGEIISIMFDHIKAIESNGMRTLIYFKEKEVMVEERFDFVRDEIKKWLNVK